MILRPIEVRVRVVKFLPQHNKTPRSIPPPIDSPWRAHGRNAVLCVYIGLKPLQANQSSPMPALNPICESKPFSPHQVVSSNLTLSENQDWPTQRLHQHSVHRITRDFTTQWFAASTRRSVQAAAFTKAFNSHQCS